MRRHQNRPLQITWRARQPRKTGQSRSGDHPQRVRIFVHRAATPSASLDREAKTRTAPEQAGRDVIRKKAGESPSSRSWTDKRLHLHGYTREGHSLKVHIRDEFARIPTAQSGSADLSFFEVNRLSCVAWSLLHKRTTIGAYLSNLNTQIVFSRVASLHDTETKKVLGGQLRDCLK